MALSDKLKESSKFSIPERLAAPTYTLEDLRNDDEVIKRTERFLSSLGEGESVGDLYQYFRGSNLNIRDTFKVLSQAEKFTDEQKKDYLFLKNKFDNANVGGFREKAQLGIDATQELVSDPLNWVSAVLVPWSGGTSLAGRLAGGEAAKLAIRQAIKEGTKLGIRKNLGRVVLNTPGQVLKSPLSKTQLAGVLAAEGAIYGGTHNYVNQSIDVTLDERDKINYGETAMTAALTAVAAPLLAGGAQLAFKGVYQIPKHMKAVQEQRISRIDNNENYKSNFYETVISGTLEAGKTAIDILKLTALPLRPTSFLRKKAKKNKILQDLLQVFKYDAMEGFIAPKIGTQPILKNDYNINLLDFWGDKSERLTSILGEKGFNLLSYESRRTSKFRRNFFNNTGLSDSVSSDLAYILRTGKDFRIINGQKKTLDKRIVGAAGEIRVILDEIYDAAVAAGLKPNRAKNYFPRFWNVDAIRKNQKAFVNLIMKQEGATKKAATDLWRRLATEGTEESSSAAGLSSRLQSERLLKNINDADFEEFLINDVESVLRQYFGESAALITRTKLLGETTDDFIKRFIIPIEKSGLNLTDVEKKYLTTMYQVTTGQAGRIDRNKKDPYFNLIKTGKIYAGFHDVMTVTMQTSLLGLSTLTSFAEIGVPLLLGNESRVTMNQIKKSIVDQGKEWWGKQKQNFGVGNPNVDVRPASRIDLNSFMTSVNLAAEDRAVAIFGQAISKPATKIQNIFFKSIGLHDWTRFVQLVGYDMGKNLVFKNLKLIADNPTAQGKNKLKDADVLRLQDELAELGIDYKEGLNWINRGARHTDDYYLKNVRAAAVRYTNEVVMNPTAASNQKPLIHSLAYTKFIYGLMGFPTAFANGPLRKVIRNMTKDTHTISSGGRKINTGRAVSGALFMTSIGLLNYTLRTGGRNFEQLENGEITIEEMIVRSMRYAGLLGPAEIYQVYTDATPYDSKIKAAIGSVVGPNLPDLYDYIKILFDRGGLAEIAFKRAPFSAALKSLHRETYDKGLEYARKLDKETIKLGPTGVEKEKAIPFTKGGLVEGVQDVPFTKENPADRVNPYTGEPYSGLVLEDFPLLNRMPMNEGGLTDEEKDRLDAEVERMGGVRSGSLQSNAPVIELLVGGNTAKIIAGIGKDGYKLVDNLLKNSKRVPKPLRYYHGSTLKLKEVTPMADRVDPKLQNMFQAASYLGKPTEGGLDIANYYARGGGFVNIIDEKVFNKIVKNLYNPRNISDDVLKNINKEITTRKKLIDFAKRTNTRKNLGKFRKELVDLENLVKPYGSGYISKVSPVQRKVLKREGFDGIDISDDVIAVFDKLPVRRAARGSLTDKLLKRRQLKELEKAQLKKGN